MDGLEHDDRIVDEPSHRERQSAEGEGVERLPRRVEGDERDRERERDRDRDDERAAQTLEEQENDERDEDERLKHLALEARIRGLHVRRFVEHRLDDHSRGKVLEPGDHLLRFLDDLERVASRHAEDVQVDRVLAVHRHRLRRCGPPILHTRDVADVHRVPVHVLHERVADCLHPVRDRVCVDVRVEGGGNEFSRGEKRVRLCDGSRDVFGRHAARLRGRAVDNDVDLPLRSAVRRCARHAGNALEQGLDVVHAIVVELRSGESAARDGHLEHRRVRWVELEDKRRNDSERLWHGRHRELNLLLNEGLGTVQIGPPRKPHVRDAQIVARDALDVLDAGCRAHVLLDAPGQGLLDVACGQPRRERPDDEDGRRQIGKRVDRHAGRHDHCEDDRRDAEHEARERVAKREACHSALP